nr:hypothetical protein BAR15_180101 [Bartonella sp. AR 15-3]
MTTLQSDEKPFPLRVILTLALDIRPQRLPSMLILDAHP